MHGCKDARNMFVDIDIDIDIDIDYNSLEIELNWLQTTIINKSEKILKQNIIELFNGMTCGQVNRYQCADQKG